MTRGAALKMSGHRETSAKLALLAGQQPRKVERALYRRAVAVLGDSQENYVPVDLGTLRGSGHVLPPRWQGNVLSVTIGYGGPAAPYALAVHEHLSAHSPRSWRAAEKAGTPVRFHPSGRGPKYLERPLRAASRTLAADLAQDLKV